MATNDLNRCEFIGRLGAEPETRYTANGTAVCNFRIAAGWKSKDKEGTEWIPIVAWGKLGEVCSQYLIKGSRVFVAGSWRTRKWQDQQGNDRYTTEIVINEMQMLDSRPDAQQARPQQPQQSAPSAQFGDDFDDSDVPF